MTLSLLELKKVLNYEESTGLFFWRITNNQWAFSQAGTIEQKGYRQIWVNGQRYKAHRLAWFYITGHWPKHQIDHINGAKDDNRFCNLREATNAQNKMNSPSRGKSGAKGVYWREDMKKWVVRIDNHHCGCFSSFPDAVICSNYNIAYAHGKFAKLNSLPKDAFGWWNYV